MKNPFAGWFVWLGVKSRWANSFLVILTVNLGAAENFDPPLLRHQFGSGTNAYMLALEMQTEEGKAIWQGHLIATAKISEKNRATITFETKLRPPSTPIRSVPYYGPQGPIWNPFEFRGPGYGIPSSCQIELDDRGRLLRSMGDFSMAPPFHELYRFLFPLFPEQPANQWTLQSEQDLPADSWGGNRRFPGYYGPMGPGQRAPARMMAQRRENWQVASLKDHQAHLRQEITIESWASFDQTPRWRITGQAEIEFDAAKGQVKTIEMPCMAVWTSETTTRRAPMVLRIERVAESELPELMATLKPEIPANLNENDLRKLLQDLESPDSDKKSKAVNTLMSATVTSISPSTLNLLEERIRTTEPYARTGLMRILAQNATSSQVPWLLGILKSSDMSVRMEAAKALGRLKEKRAAEPLANIIAQGQFDQAAIEALKQIGPPAEEAVLTLLREKHQETRRQACEILQQIGTSRSLEPLRAVLLSTEESIGSSARQAIQEIQARLTMIEAESQ